MHAFSCLAGRTALLALATCLGSPAWAQEEPIGGQGLRLQAAKLWSEATDREAWQGEGYWRVAFAPAAPHFRPSAEHRHVVAVALERQRPDDWLAGFSFFRNSFGQPSAYAYLGRQHGPLLGQETLFFQWSAGVLYGYKGEYKNKVALNVKGFAPGALVGLGWRVRDRGTLLVHLLGDAALMFQFSYDLR